MLAAAPLCMCACVCVCTCACAENIAYLGARVKIV